ncbi:adenylate kinase [Pseudoalteromonas luteoviolacea]|uniref:adenylate kinase n=1 Tax=Pseudoalteromonas luteoviolacea TaxID=43657 RepID=UPI00114F5D86|nr:adenylate kinase [Pseudoalteromonas luteoviolacea]TQF71077.1 adenylate kinase [Pseudoalteromonas luteoviolacea]
MKKIAIFGKPGSGKSTFSAQLASLSGIPLHQIDTMAFNTDGSQVLRSKFDKAHDKILNSESWILDGLGPIGSFQQRIACADTLIYIDLPYPLSYWLVTKRFLKGMYQKPKGWPDGSSLAKGTLQSYKFLGQSRRFWNESFYQSLRRSAKEKALYRVTTLNELNGLLKVLVPQH